MHPEKYGVKHFIKFGDYNIGLDDGIKVAGSVIIRKVLAAAAYH